MKLISNSIWHQQETLRPSSRRGEEVSVHLSQCNNILHLLMRLFCLSSYAAKEFYQGTTATKDNKAAAPEYADPRIHG